TKMADQSLQNARPRILSGMRPTGKLHLGNYVGALQNWVKLQNSYDSFFFVADWHALTTDYDDTARVADNTLEVVLDYLAAGLDPEKCTIFVQSHVLQHAELHVLFSMITPLGWLERVPSYKEQQQNLSNKDLHMYGFLGYPLLQAADILIYRPRFVPVGEDQAAHVELTREVARRFNSFYNLKEKPIFPEPEALLTPAAKLLGMDKRKMSKSYGNSILLSDEAATVEEKIKNSVTDRPKLTDHGSPDRCPVGNLHQIFSDRERLEYITQGCTQATIPCTECKGLAIESVNAHLSPIRQRRQELAQHPERLHKIIQHGAEKANAAAEQTLTAVREAVGLLRIGAVESLVIKDEGPGALRVPESIASATTEEERWELRTAGWLERLSTTYPLKKDRPRTFITRKGRKVGIYAAAENNGEWKFSVEDRPVNVLALLAEDKEHVLHDYVLPPKVVQDSWKKFSRSDNSVQVILRKTNSGSSLILPDGEEISIQQYKGDTSALQ
ncbi:MAG TPA: tryptophan--tRNA ligase, partial [Candidatus Angelobacter sp.]|nr:tryptophan--tRNA ligase [Candidatus Angelobacter sp.]